MLNLHVRVVEDDELAGHDWMLLEYPGRAVAVMTRSAYRQPSVWRQVREARIRPQAQAGVVA